MLIAIEFVVKDILQTFADFKLHFEESSTDLRMQDAKVFCIPTPYAAVS